MILREIKKEEYSRWDHFVSAQPKSHIFQSTGWGEIKAQAGWRPMYVCVEEGNTIKAAILILKRTIPFLGRCVLYAPRGPILDYDDTETFDFLIEQIKKIAQEQRAIFFLIDPDISEQHENLKKYLKERGFVWSIKYGVVGLTQPKRVFRLNLQKTEDELLAQMRQGHRYNIRLAQRNNISIEQDNTLNGLKIFYTLLKETSRRKNFYIRSFSYQKIVFNQFVSTGNVKIFLAQYNEEIVGAASLLCYGDKVWYMYGASKDRLGKREPGYLLLWEAIKWARTHGYVWFDFRGADSPDPHHPLHGVYLFKKGFGPDYIDFIGEYYLIFSPLYFGLINKGKQLLNCGIKIYKKINGLKSILIQKQKSPQKNDEQVLRESVIKKYDREEEIVAHSELIKEGLFVPEGRLVDTYFTSGAHLLNIGCGAGREALALLKRGYSVVGTDIQPKMVARAKENAKEENLSAQFVTMNACDLDFPDESFDHAMMVGSIITHIPKRANRVRALQQAHRVLKKGGVIIVSTPNRDSKFKYRLYFFFVNTWRRFCKKVFHYSMLEEGDRFGRKVSKARSSGSVYWHMYSMKEMIEDMEMAGFKVLECRSREELEKNTEIPHRRKKDYFLYFSARKV